MKDLFTIARKNGSGAIVWSEDQVRFILDSYGKTESLKSLSELFHVRPESIRNLLRKKNIPILKSTRVTHPVDSHYFDTIDTPEKAYWLGIFYSDGFINSDRKAIGLASKDKDLIEKFKKALKADNHKVSESTDTRFSKPCTMYMLSIKEKTLWEGLNKNGIIPRKSWEQFGLPNLENNLMRHFVRGYFDGDGGLSWSHEKKYYGLSFTGNFQFLTELKEYLGVEHLSLCQNSVSKITYDFKIGGRRQVLDYLEFLYKDSTPETRLNRKYESYQKLLGALPLNQ